MAERDDEEITPEMERSFAAAAGQFHAGLPIHADDDMIAAAVDLRDAMSAAKIVAETFTRGEPPTFEQVLLVYDRLVATQARGTPAAAR